MFVLTLLLMLWLVVLFFTILAVYLNESKVEVTPVANSTAMRDFELWMQKRGTRHSFSFTM